MLKLLFFFPMKFLIVTPEKITLYCMGKFSLCFCLISQMSVCIRASSISKVRAGVMVVTTSVDVQTQRRGSTNVMMCMYNDLIHCCKNLIESVIMREDPK